MLAQYEVLRELDALLIKEGRRLSDFSDRLTKRLLTEFSTRLQTQFSSLHLPSVASFKMSHVTYKLSYGRNGNEFRNFSITSSSTISDITHKVTQLTLTTPTVSPRPKPVCVRRNCRVHCNFVVDVVVGLGMPGVGGFLDLCRVLLGIEDC